MNAVKVEIQGGEGSDYVNLINSKTGKADIQLGGLENDGISISGTTINGGLFGTALKFTSASLDIYGGSQINAPIFGKAVQGTLGGTEANYSSFYIGMATIDGDVDVEAEGEQGFAYFYDAKIEGDFAITSKSTGTYSDVTMIQVDIDGDVDIEMGDAADTVTIGGRIGGILRINTGGGNDTIKNNTAARSEIFGGAGHDKIDGGVGDDYLDGGDGNDIINGHNGRDAIVGGAGNDIVRGGTGADRFLLMENARGEYDDAVMDLRSWEDDVRVRFDNYDGFPGIPGNNGVTNFLNNSLSALYRQIDILLGSAATWSSEEVYMVDQAFSTMVARTGNNALLRHPNGSEMTFVQVSNAASYAGMNLPWDSVILLDQTNFSNASRLKQTVFHEIGHNFDSSFENPFINKFYTLSGWTSDPRFVAFQEFISRNPELYALAESPINSFGVYYGAPWWHIRETEFARDYGKSHPIEDWATSFAAVLMNFDRNERMYHTFAGEVNAASTVQRIGAKAAVVDLLFESLGAE